MYKQYGQMHAPADAAGPQRAASCGTELNSTAKPC
jgi:hypothetical protein